MYTEQVPANQEFFTDDLILKQVDKILEHPLFRVSDVLPRFLKYIINETLSGRTNQIKEYTIAKYVLNKSPESMLLNGGIVRVHARRLRDALNKYYEDRTVENECEIFIPKGGYIPAFRAIRPMDLYSRVRISNRRAIFPAGSVKIAILPFQTFDEFDSRVAFADNIGQILSAEINHLPDFSVLSYYTSQQLHLKNRDIKSIAADYGVNYVLVGNLHFESSRLRVTIQFINAGTEMLIWSDNHMYELARTSLFEIADLIVARVMNSMAEFNDRLSKPAREVIELNRNPGTKKIASF